MLSLLHLVYGVAHCSRGALNFIFFINISFNNFSALVRLVLIILYVIFYVKTFFAILFDVAKILFPVHIVVGKISLIRRSERIGDRNKYRRDCR